MFAIKHFTPNSDTFVVSPSHAELSGAFQNERSIYITRNLEHENIIKILGFEDMSIRMEYCEGGSLEKFRSGLEFDVAMNHITGLLKALDYLHHKNVVHLNVKPESCLIKGGSVKLSDFESARFLLGDPHRQDKYLTIPNTYSAPELMDFHTNFTEKQITTTDVWSAGVIFIKLLLGFSYWAEARVYDRHFREWSFYAEHPHEDMKCALAEELMFKSPHCVGLLKNMVVPTEKRQSASTILEKMATIRPSKDLKI